MRERFKQWQSKIRITKWWLMGAIATPVFLGMVGGLWLLPDRILQLEDGRLSQNESVTLAHPDRETLISSIGAIAMVAGGAFLLLNFRMANRNEQTVNLSGVDLSGIDLGGVDLSGVDLNGANLSDTNLSSVNLSDADLSSTDLIGANLSGANLSGANLNGANLNGANLSGSDLSGAELRYANLSDANLRYTNLSGADLRYANLSGADLNCALLTDANFSEVNLSGALLFFLNSREVKNLEPAQLKAKHSPFLCNVALPSYSSHQKLNPNRDCDRIPHLLSARYHISLEEAQGIVDEARQHRWD